MLRTAVAPAGSIIQPGDRVTLKFAGSKKKRPHQRTYLISENPEDHDLDRKRLGTSSAWALKLLARRTGETVTLPEAEENVVDARIIRIRR